MKTKTAFLLLLFLGIFSCTKKYEPKPVYINQTMKDWFDYKVGSYWVFYDSLNNTVDSLIVAYRERTEPFKDPDQAGEHISAIAYLYDKTTNQMKSTWNLSIYAPSSFNITIDPYNMLVAGLNHSLVTSVPFELASKSHRECILLPGYSVNGEGFKDVYEIRVHDTVHNTFFDNIYYMDRDAGFISIIHNSKPFKEQLFLIRRSVLK